MLNSYYEIVKAALVAAIKCGRGPSGGWISQSTAALAALERLLGGDPRNDQRLPRGQSRRVPPVSALSQVQIQLEYGAMFDEVMRRGCDYVSNIVVEQTMEGWYAFCGITLHMTHTKAAGVEDHNA
jgi:hypothetical protein